MAHFTSSDYFEAFDYLAKGGAPAPTPPVGNPSTYLRTALATKIADQKTAEDYIYNNFNIEETWLPREKLVDLKKDNPNGKLWLVTSSFDDTPNNTRKKGGLCTRECSVMLGYQIAGINSQDLEAMDTIVQLIHEFYESCRKLNPDDYPLLDPEDFSSPYYQWTGTVAQKDEDGIPYTYTSLQAHNLFEAYFTATYLITIY